VADPAGLDVAGMLRSEHASPVPQLGAGAALPSAALFEQRADILILAAGEDAMPMAVADALSIPVVVVGANCGLSPAVEARLHERGVLVVPDFVGGIGGSASMEALFGPVRRPSGQAVLDGVSQIMSRLVTELFIQARDRGLPLRAVADDFAAAAAARLCPGERPYGCSPFLDRAPVASVAHGLSR
jgi:glutamate dehydrogenase (NAD(P)+)